jgi:hypothetical protein
LSNKAIAERLGLTKATVDYRVSRMVMSGEAMPPRRGAPLPALSAARPAAFAKLEGELAGKPATA